jgi:molecular chaperone DnaK (HSP70)
VLGRDEELAEVLLFDVNPLSLGTDCANGSLSVLIPRNAPIPAKMTEIDTTNIGNQSMMHVGEHEGEDDVVANNHLIDEFNLTGIEAAPKGRPRIVVTFETDKNGILSASAAHRKWRVKVSLKMGSDKHRLSGEELVKAKRRTEESEWEREKRCKMTKAKNDLEHYLREVTKRVTSGEMIRLDEDQNAALQIVNSGVEWVEDNPNESAEAYEKMKVTYKEGMNALPAGDEP